MSNNILKNKINNLLNPNISVDCVIFGFDTKELHVLLIDRENELKNVVSAHALPGNLIYDHENLNMAAERVLKELTGLSNIYLEQFGAFGEPDRIKKKVSGDINPFVIVPQQVDWSVETGLPNIDAPLTVEECDWAWYTESAEST